jgi:hemerythrin superfamily protein
MTIFDALKHDHDTIKALLSQIESDQAAIAQGQFEALKALVIAHSRAEEDMFYSELEEFDATEARVEHSVEEHQTIESMLNALDEGAVGSPTFEAVKAILLHHIREEEDELFKQAKTLLTESDLARMGAAFAAEKQRLLDAKAPAAKKTA